MPNFIDKETYMEANKKLPDIAQLGEKILQLSPNIISINAGYNSDLPIAATCFQDTINTLSEARYALLESLVHKNWYLEKTNPPNELNAVFFGRFYVDDAALRLYSAAEHLAKAIVYIFNIENNKIKANRSDSRFKTVKNILLKEKPKHLITQTIIELYNSNDWKSTVKYRNSWVHQQPPIIKGLGIHYERKRRWEHSKIGWTLHLLNGGDKPRYSIDDVLGFLCPALFQFSDKLTIVVDYYIAELKTRRVIK